MITWTKGSEWGLNGMDLKDIPENLYEAIHRLQQYESLGLEPEEIVLIDNLYLEKCQEVNNTIKLDKAAAEWFRENPEKQVTLCSCNKCKLYYKPTEGHKCQEINNFTK
jgi:hypothetical protein